MLFSNNNTNPQKLNNSILINSNTEIKTNSLKLLNNKIVIITGLILSILFIINNFNTEILNNLNFLTESQNYSISEFIFDSNILNKIYILLYTEYNFILKFLLITIFLLFALFALFYLIQDHLKSQNSL